MGSGVQLDALKLCVKLNSLLVLDKSERKLFAEVNGDGEESIMSICCSLVLTCELNSSPNAIEEVGNNCISFLSIPMSSLASLEAGVMAAVAKLFSCLTAFEIAAIDLAMFRASKTKQEQKYYVSASKLVQ